jgi:2-methylcitrate dehydratase PrpD
MAESLSLALARYAATTSAEAIPGAVRERTKQVILDELASACFGNGQPAGDLAARYALSCGGPGECLILGTEAKAPAAYAALANGAAGHADEIDGAHVVGGHPGATLVHAAMAIAERIGAPGSELLNAVALGYDVGTRLIEACGGVFGVKDRYHLHADFLNAVGAAVACGRLLRLAPGQLCNAMALATFQANGLCSLFRERRHISKALCNGQYAFAGVSAALMAAAGLEGCDDVLGEPDGLLDAWGVVDGGALLTRGLGDDYKVMGANFKFLRAGYPIHAVIEATTTLVSRHGIAPANIGSVVVGMPANAMRVVDDRLMHNICVQDVLSVALLRGDLHLGESYFPAILDDPAFAAMRARIRVRVDPDLEVSQPDGRGAVVTITTGAGVAVSHRVDHPHGHSLRGGVTWADLSAKWHDAMGGRGYDIDAWVGRAQRLEDLADAGMLTDAFAKAE